MFSAIEDSDSNIGISAAPDFPKDDVGARLYLSRIIMQFRINSLLNQMNTGVKRILLNQLILKKAKIF